MYSYNYDITAYFQQLYQYVERQNQRINQLEQTIRQLHKQLEEIKQRPTTHIDKIEYKFDQLKVETLEGTLNIGLNPTNGESIEDFAVSQGKMNIPDVRHVHNQLIEDIEKEIDEFLSTDCHRFIEKQAKQERYSLAEGYTEFILDDIGKQINERIIFYLQQHQAELQDPSRESQVYQSIINKLKTDIQNSITAFMNNIPNNMKVGNEK